MIRSAAIYMWEKERTRPAEMGSTTAIPTEFQIGYPGQWTSYVLCGQHLTVVHSGQYLFKPTCRSIRSARPLILSQPACLASPFSRRLHMKMRMAHPLRQILTLTGRFVVKKHCRTLEGPSFPHIAMLGSMTEPEQEMLILRETIK